MSIVVGYDESAGADAALATAITVASKYGEPLLIVYGAAPPGQMGEEFKAHQAAIMELGRTALSHAVERAEAAGVTTQVHLVDAKPVDALLKVSEEHDATVIVVGTSGESPIKGAIIGSTPHKLLHLAKVPVLCVPIR